MNPGLAADEKLRLEALRQYNILDTAPEVEFDDFTTLATNLCETPIAIITLLDEKRQWFKSQIGLQVNETPREIAFCDHTVRTRDVFIVPDAIKDPRFNDNPLVTQEPQIRFYAGAPLITPEGFVVGTLSVIDRVPRQLTPTQHQALEILARHVVTQLELRRNLAKLKQTIVERNKAEEELRQTQKELEMRVLQRSAQLHEANAAMHREIAQRIAERNVSDALLNSLPGIFYLFDESGKFLRWNDNFAQVTEYSNEEIDRRHPLDFFKGGQDKELIAQKIREAFDAGQAQSEASLLTKNGREIPYLFDARRIRMGEKFCLCGMGIDITERKRSEQSLLEAEERYRKLVEMSPNAIFVLKKNQWMFANPAGLELMGASSLEQLRVRPALDFVHSDSRAEIIERIHLLEKELVAVPRLEEKFVQVDGTVIDVEVDAAPFMDNGEAARLVVARDITEAKRYKQQLEIQANYDALTGLANRNLLNDRLQQAIAYADRHHALVIVVFIDLDNFKLINDTLGHEIGDRLLMQCATCLKQCVREDDTVARHGGDEFVLVLHDHLDEDAITAWMHRLIGHVSKPFVIGEHELFITCSMGLTIYPRDGKDAPTLLKNADAAMYQAKAEGRNQFQFFTSCLNDRVKERFSIEAKLRRALEREEFVLYYQPQVDLATGKIVGNEALIRWRDPEAGLISPIKFISVAEETGLIVPIGEWVLEKACLQNKQLHDAGLNHLSVSVNVSARQFYPTTLIKAVQSALRSSKLDAQYLKLEVTESTVMNRPDDAKQMLDRLKQMGVLAAIDDFGVGYSSLSYLQRFPMDQLKIDQSFVQQVDSDRNNAVIAQAVISLGHSLRLKVVAEGVCNENQLAFLRERRCDEIQGNYFSEALPYEKLEHLLLMQKKALTPVTA